MSESIEVNLLMAIMAVSFQLGRRMAHGKGSQSTVQQRHLLKQVTQILDGTLLRLVLTQQGIPFEEGGARDDWGIPGKIEMQIKDENGQPWLALGRDAKTQAFVVYSQDNSFDQSELTPTERLSAQDPAPVLSRVAQQYGYLKSLQALLQNGYQIKDNPEKRADGTQVVVLQKTDEKSGELHTVRLIFQAQDGTATILTDSRRKDGTHGVCPDLDPILSSIGLLEHAKWTSPAARQAQTEGKSKPARNQQDVPDQGKTHQKRRAAGQE